MIPATTSVFKYEYAISTFGSIFEKNSKIVATTGFTSRELYQIRKYKKYLNKGKDFYMVGGMGHASMVSLAHSLFYKNAKLG